MSKAKKIILTVVAVIFGLLTIINTAGLILTIWTFNDINVNFYSHYPFLQPSTNYLKIDEIGYVSTDVAFISPETIKNGEEIKIYTLDEIVQENKEAWAAINGETSE